MNIDRILPWKQKEAYGSILLSILGLLVLNILVLKGSDYEWFRATGNQSLITSGLFFMQTVIFMAPIFYLMKRYSLRAKAFGFRSIGWKQTLLWPLKGFLAVFIFNMLFIFLLDQFGLETLPGFSPQESHIPFFGTSPFDIGLSVAILLVIAPVVEEFFFRGFLLQTLLGKFRPILANIVAAGFFALIHFEFQSIGIILFLAFLLNWMYLRTRSIVPGIVFHIVNNALAFGMEWFVWNGR